MAAREIRLGMVLYGGVSLAVYENGIVQEIYRAICGESVYELISELIDSDLVVDVISGTSAGGVNGIMLGYSLANGLDFLPSADLWRELGDIDKLMRKVDDKEDASLLDSQYYQDELKSCYANTLKPPVGKVAPAIGELDLFVTGTDANGVISTVYDELGHPIDVKNHRALFQLQYRGTRKNDFSFGPGGVPVTADDMATLSRLTSGFPVAFKPVEIGGAADFPNLHRWGNLSGPAVFMDGGILNNKPFTSTIEAIQSRTAIREVERFLIYVEPSPEQFVKPVGAPAVPDVVQAGMRSLTSIPSYQSIATDLQAIEAHNERALQLKKIVGILRPAPDAALDCLMRATVVPAVNDPCDGTAYLIARLSLVKNAAVEAILNNPDGRRGFFQSMEAKQELNAQAGQGGTRPTDERRSGRLLVQSFWYWAGNEFETLTNYDVFFRKRRADHLSSALMDVMTRNDDPVDVPQVACEAINHFFKLYEITEWAMKRWLTVWQSNWTNLSADNPHLDVMDADSRKKKLGEISKQIWGSAKDVLDRLMTCDVAIPAFDFQSPKALADAREVYYTLLIEWMKAPATGSGTNLLQALDESLKAAIGSLEGAGPTAAAGRVLRNEFCRFLKIDRQLLPMQVGSEFESTDVIRVVRFSPLEAQRGMSKGAIEDKVRGTALANFGAFFKKSWRANDIMMGRFDAACLLTECLLTKERLGVISAKFRAAGIVYTVPPAVLATSLPSASAVQSANVARTIAAYFATPMPTDAMWEAMMDAIVGAAHAEILAEEWPRVAASTLQQQYAWGSYREDASLPAGLGFPSRWTAAKASPDELLVKVAANAISQGMLPPYDPLLNRKKKFLEEIPLTAVQEQVSLAMVRLGRSLLASVPEGKARDAVAGNLIFKIPMQWIPGFFYQLTHTRRTQPDWLLVPMVVILNLALSAVFVFAWLLEQKRDLSLTYAVVMTAGVLAAALVQWVLTRKRPAMVAIWILTAIVAGVIAVVAGDLEYGPISKPNAHEMELVIRCAGSLFVIWLYGMFRLKKAAWQMVGAVVAGLLVLLVWR